MTENYKMLNVEEISFDTENPRIKMALMKYGDRLNAERIHFALRSAADGDGSTSSYEKLKDSIRASRGVMSPINIIIRDGSYVCIDGNTRLAIYKQFLKENVEGIWSEIKAIVLDNAEQRDIERIRMSAHLVGSREWPAYEKASYLYELRNSRFMDYSEMIAICGGSKLDIERQIEAYCDMNEYYRDSDAVDDTAFNIDRFSGFVELQKPKIKEAIFDAGLELKNFGEWIHDGRIYRLADVRNLPKVLRDDEAKETFLNGGHRSIEAAIKLLDRKAEEARQTNTEITLETASVYQLAEALSRRINDLPYAELRALKDKAHDDVAEQIGALEGLSVCLDNLLEDVSE